MAVTPLTFTANTGATDGGGTSAIDSSFRWLVAWIALIALLAITNRTRIGHVAIYYALWLTLLLLLVTQYKGVASLLAPIGAAPTSQSDIPGSGTTVQHK